MTWTKLSTIFIKASITATFAIELSTVPSEPVSSTSAPIDHQLALLDQDAVFARMLTQDS